MRRSDPPCTWRRNKHTCFITLWVVKFHSARQCRAWKQKRGNAGKLSRPRGSSSSPIPFSMAISFQEGWKSVPSQLWDVSHRPCLPTHFLSQPASAQLPHQQWCSCTGSTGTYWVLHWFSQVKVLSQVHLAHLVFPWLLCSLCHVQERQHWIWELVPAPQPRSMLLQDKGRVFLLKGMICE